jgi:predicted glycosyl hydrolase (DUF1957 family)
MNSHRWHQSGSAPHCKHRLTEEHEEITEKLEKAEEHKNQFNELDKEITDYEISRAAKKIKLKKAAYSDKINNEMIKSSIDILNKGFIKVFNIIITSGIFPRAWCEGLITPIFKSGTKLDLTIEESVCQVP